ncbi:MAG: hypothetical protein ACTSXS_01300 [Candidatus Thorarchaeota archaeon]
MQETESNIFGIEHISLIYSKLSATYSYTKASAKGLPIWSPLESNMGVDGRYLKISLFIDVAEYNTQDA